MSFPKVLLIDDNSAEYFFMGSVLQKAGYEIHMATDGRSGLMMASALHPHCLIVDIMLPDINGYDVCRRIRAVDEWHTLPIVLIGAKDTALDRSYALRIGADCYLPKPFSAEDLLKAVWNVLPAHSRPASAPPPVAQPKPLENIFPRRRENSEFLTSSNPFAHSLRLDRPTRRLLALIDGGKTLSVLCKETRSTEHDVLKLLKTLFEQHLIEFYDQHGHLLEESPFKRM